MSDLTERPTALVLAGTRGLGAASAAALAQAGHPVAICGRTKESVDAGLVTLRDHADTAPVTGLVADVSKPDDLRGAVDQTADELGEVGVLVANAGGPPAGGFFDVGPEDWERAYHLTLMSFVHAVRAVAPAMRTAGRGRIVLIGSSSVRKPIPNLVLSNAFRPALAGVVKDLAVTLAPEGVTVNMVSPGRIDTDRVRDLDGKQAEAKGLSVEEVRARAEQAIPAGRYGEPAELGALVAFLASEAAGYITGQSVLVDGGMVPTLP